VDNIAEAESITPEESGFLDYLRLQGSKPDLITKSELVTLVREQGLSIGERQLAFYVSEGIIPKSVRVGSRAGAYPRVVAELLTWVVRSRDHGLPVDVIRELIPVWKLLVEARGAGVLQLGELEYIARQRVHSREGSMAVPAVVAEVLHTCDDCYGHRNSLVDMVVIMKDGTKQKLGDKSTTLGFAIGRLTDVTDDEGIVVGQEPRWSAHTRVTLADTEDPATDPTTVILGLRPNEPVPQPREESMLPILRGHRSEGGEVHEEA
jgi:DNA-binding transcriptional MerR regulator